MYFSASFVVFDKTGEIFVIDAGVENRLIGPEREFGVFGIINAVYHSEEPWGYEGTPAKLFEDNWNEQFKEKYNKEFSELLPEELRGEISFIVSFLAVDDEPIR